jgi:hypothetical protein
VNVMGFLAGFILGCGPLSALTFWRRLRRKPESWRTGRPAIALDFDGVIHAFTSPWRGEHIIADPPVEGAFKFIEDASCGGFDVIIHTARANSSAGRMAVRRWLQVQGLPEMFVHTIRITAEKPAAVIYIDDRGFRFEGTFPTLDAICRMRQWNRQRPEWWQRGRFDR